MTRLFGFIAFQSIFFNIAWIGFWIAWGIAFAEHALYISQAKRLSLRMPNQVDRDGRQFQNTSR